MNTSDHSVKSLEARGVGTLKTEAVVMAISLVILTVIGGLLYWFYRRRGTK